MKLASTIFAAIALMLFIAKGDDTYFTISMGWVMTLYVMIHIDHKFDNK